MSHHLEHLAPLVDLGDPSLFASHVRWLDELLRVGNVSTVDVAQSLHETARVIRATFPCDEPDAVEPSLRARQAQIGAGDLG